MSALEAVRAVCRAWEELDPVALAALFTRDGIFDDPLKSSRLAGSGAILEGNRAAMAQLRTCRIELRHVLGDGDVAVAEGRFVAELDPDGVMDFPFAMVVELSGGRISRLAEYFDTRPLLA
jgi:ketosteroid isomerase-like protein